MSFRLQFRRDPFSLGPYILRSARAITVRMGRAVLCLRWGR